MARRDFRNRGQNKVFAVALITALMSHTPDAETPPSSGAALTTSSQSTLTITTTPASPTASTSRPTTVVPVSSVAPSRAVTATPTITPTLAPAHTVRVVVGAARPNILALPAHQVPSILAVDMATIDSAAVVEQYMTQIVALGIAATSVQEIGLFPGSVIVVVVLRTATLAPTLVTAIAAGGISVLLDNGDRATASPIPEAGGRGSPAASPPLPLLFLAVAMGIGLCIIIAAIFGVVYYIRAWSDDSDAPPEKSRQTRVLMTSPLFDSLPREPPEGDMDAAAQLHTILPYRQQQSAPCNMTAGSNPQNNGWFGGNEAGHRIDPFLDSIKLSDRGESERGAGDLLDWDYST